MNINLKQIINETVKTDWKDLLLEIDTEELDEYLTERKDICDQLDFGMFPPQDLIFNCFSFFDIKDIKVTVISQDPFIRPGQAMGLCFSVPEKIKIPPSLRNIYKEISDDLEIDTSERNGDLTHWAEQGILLLNSALTVMEGKPNSHQKKWTPYTNQLIKMISERTENVIFILWGNNARSKKKLIDTDKHYIIEGVHPSPLSANRGFFGCKHFSECNEILKSLGKEPINW